MQANLLLLRYFVNFYISGGSLTNDKMHNTTSRPLHSCRFSVYTLVYTKTSKSDANLPNQT